MKYLKPAKFPRWMKIDAKVTDTKRYKIIDDSIVAQFYNDSNLPHCNHIEMSGFFTSSIISYKIKENRELDLYRFCVFPTVRVKPNDTHGSLPYKFKGIDIEVMGEKEKIEKVSFNGILSFKSTINDLTINRRFVVATDKRALIEEIQFTNPSKEGIKVNLANPCSEKVIRKMFLDEDTDFHLKSKICSKNADISKGVKINNGITTIYFLYYIDDMSYLEIKKQVEKREKFISESKNTLVVETPNEQINKMLEFTKIRASESIFKTKNGLMHSPGGGGYYAALWTNDQCEYANPLFAYLGYNIADEQSINCYDLYSKFVKSDEVIPSSIISEGDDVWHGAGDRGDNSMYVYGFARYLLTRSDKALAEKYLSNLEVATEYVISQINENSVVKSDSDELENRFKSGKANLSTSCITYDALISLSHLEAEFDNGEKAENYLKIAEKIKNGIENYFGSEVEGYSTYRYCEGENRLRSWICLPLCVGIFNRAEQTAEALLSEKLKMGNGMLTRSGEKTYWDRSSLYALRGLFYAGENDAALDFLESYTNERISGEHVPYPVEAFPEGNAAHLSAESALYVRIFIEGMMGYRPTGFGKFELAPNLPSKWNDFSISSFSTYGQKIDFYVKRNDDGYQITISALDKPVFCKAGEKILIEL